MAGEIFMPQLGLTMNEGVLVEWLKKAGDPVRAGEPIMLVETDKATQEVTALEDGVIETILVEAGATVPVGTVLASLRSAPGERAVVVPPRQPPTSPATESRAGAKPVAPPPPPPPATAGRLVATPLARRAASRLGVRLELVQGRGPGGRILVGDVERFAAAAPDPRPAPAEGKEIELQGLRKLTAERMAYSFSTAPHFCLSMEVDAGELSALRERLQRTAGKKPGLEITYTDLLVGAAAIALREHPSVNACWTGSAVREWKRVNIGIAVAVEDGLTVPVIQDADRLSLAGIARQRARLVELARAGRLALADLEGGTFTISNLGMFGIDFFQAIINPPQAAILAVGRIKERPAVHEGQVKPRPILYLSLAGDHRILDGAAGARFLARLAGLLEDPLEILLAEGSNEA